MPDGISRPYTEQGGRNFDKIFKKEEIPENIKKELEKMRIGEAVKTHRRRKREKNIDPTILESCHSDKRQRFKL
jgi:hypothetical protein